MFSSNKFLNREEPSDLGWTIMKAFANTFEKIENCLVNTNSQRKLYKKICKTKYDFSPSFSKEIFKLPIVSGGRYVRFPGNVAYLLIGWFRNRLFPGEL